MDAAVVSGCMEVGSMPAKTAIPTGPMDLPLIVGELPTVRTMHRYSGTAGRALRLAEVCDWTLADLTAICRFAHLPLPLSRETWLSTLAQFRGRVVILVGYRIAGNILSAYPVKYFERISAGGTAFYVVPNLAVANTWYNVPENRQRARTFFRRVLKSIARRSEDACTDTETGRPNLHRQRHHGDGAGVGQRQTTDRSRSTQGGAGHPGRSGPQPKKRKFRAHQLTAYNWAADRDAVPLLMQMRLGKTLTAIRAAEDGREGPVLVVAPPTVLRRAWARELALEGIPFELLEGPTAKKKQALALGAAFGKKWFLINYEGLRAWRESADALAWDTMLLDEPTFIRNPKATITKLIRRKFKHVRRRFILTGLLTPEGEQDAFEPMAWCLGGEFMGCDSYYKWRLKYMAPSGFGWEMKPSARKKTMEAVAAASFSMTCKQAGVFCPKTYETIEVPLSPDVQKVYRHCEQRWEVQVGKEYRSARHSVAAMTWLRQLAAGVPPQAVAQAGGCWTVTPQPRHREIARLCAEDLKDDGVVIWYEFNAEMMMLQQVLRDVGIEAGLLSANTKPAQRDKVCEDFQQRKRRVVMSQHSVGKFGIDLSSGTAMIISTNGLGYETRAQLEARCDAVGKDRPTLIIDVVAPDTVSEDVLEALNTKGVSATNFMETVTKMVMKRGGEIWQRA